MSPALFLRLIILLSREVDILIPYLVFAFRPAYGRSATFLWQILGFSLWSGGGGLAAASKHHKYGVSMDHCFLWLGLAGVGFPGSEAEGNVFAHGSCFPLAFGLCAGYAGLCCIILFFRFCKHRRGVPHAYSGPRVTYLSSRHDGNESPFPTNALFSSLSGSTPSTAHPLLPTPILTHKLLLPHISFPLPHHHHSHSHPPTSPPPSLSLSY